MKAPGPASRLFFVQICLLFPSSCLGWSFSLPQKLGRLLKRGLWRSHNNNNNNIVLVSLLLDNDAAPHAVHEQLMKLALEQARQAARREEVPVGAIVVAPSVAVASTNNNNNNDDTLRFELLGAAHNCVETNHDASAHAELLAMRQSAAKRKNWRLNNTTLYSTLEPCPMCLAAAQAFRVNRIVYGAPSQSSSSNRGGGGGGEEEEGNSTHSPTMKHDPTTIPEIVPGVLQQECADLLVDFFRQRRKQQKQQATTTSASQRRFFSWPWKRRQ